MTPVCGPLKLSVNGERIRVPSMEHLKCPSCGEVMFGLKEGMRGTKVAKDIYRKKYNLLTADEIRDLRESRGLTQAELAELLRLGANTISRWESGRVVQSAALDTLLRLIRDIPGTIDYLRDRAA
jgi:putative zinc finger/helix-turn-helix YgiT family protein